MQIFVIIALAIAIVAVIFAVQNAVPVTVSFLVWKFQGSLALVLLVATATGALISLLASVPSLVKGGWTASRQKKKLAELETHLSDHKAKLEEAQKKLQEKEKPEAPSPKPPQPSA